MVSFTWERGPLARSCQAIAKLSPDAGGTPALPDKLTMKLLSSSAVNTS